MGKIRYLMVNPDIKPCPFCFQRKVVIICRGGIMFFALSLGLLLGLLLDFVGVIKKAVNEKGGDYSPAVCYSADEAIRVLEAYLQLVVRGDYFTEYGDYAPLSDVLDTTNPGGGENE